MTEEKMLFVVWGNFSPRGEDIVAHFQPAMIMRFIHYPRLKAVPFFCP
jgi:hypothetical protein